MPKKNSEALFLGGFPGQRVAKRWSSHQLRSSRQQGLRVLERLPLGRYLSPSKIRPWWLQLGFQDLRSPCRQSLLRLPARRSGEFPSPSVYRPTPPQNERQAIPASEKAATIAFRIKEGIDSALEGQPRCDAEEAQSSLSQALMLLMQQMFDYEMPEEAMAEASAMRMGGGGGGRRDIPRANPVPRNGPERVVARGRDAFSSESATKDRSRIGKVPSEARDGAPGIVLEFRGVLAQKYGNELSYVVLATSLDGVEGQAVSTTLKGVGNDPLVQVVKVEVAALAWAMVRCSTTEIAFELSRRNDHRQPMEFRRHIGVAIGREEREGCHR